MSDFTTINSDNKTKNITNNNESFWDTIADEKILNSDKLVLAVNLKKHGLPKDSHKRAVILHTLRSVSDNQYPINYEGMCVYLDEFEQLYSNERVINLIKSNLTGKQHYVTEINNSGLSEEEKELLLFVVPL